MGNRGKDYAETGDIEASKGISKGQFAIFLLVGFFLGVEA